MSKHAKKMAKAPTPVKKSFPKKAKASKIIQKGKKTQNDVFRLGGKMSENLANNANELSAKVVDISSYNAHAWNGFGGVAREIFNNINNEVMENYRNSVSNCVETSMEALKCKNANDVLNLQSKALQRMIEGCFEQSSKFSKVLFESYANALKLPNESTSPTPTDLTTDVIRKLLIA